jgi:WhiB family transcriptional regulator, redox-sensing transcriptional regulator
MSDQVVWIQHAACKGADPDIFYDSDREREALSYCYRCDVADECLEHALTRPETEGVWGATTERQRYTILDRRKRRPA